MIPFRLILAGIAAGGLVFAGWQVRDWQADADELERTRKAEERRIKDADRAAGAAQTFEEQRDAIRRELLASLPPPALAAPSQQCPAVAVGDLVLPRGSLDRVRAAAGEPGPDADPAEPRPAVPSGAAAP